MQQSVYNFDGMLEGLASAVNLHCAFAQESTVKPYACILT